MWYGMVFQSATSCCIRSAFGARPQPHNLAPFESVPILRHSRTAWSFPVMAVRNNNVIEGQLADALSTIQDTWLIASQVFSEYTGSVAHRCKRATVVQGFANSQVCCRHRWWQTALYRGNCDWVILPDLWSWECTVAYSVNTIPNVKAMNVEILP